jgi:nucleotide-binding universal stress UspA family protein
MFDIAVLANDFRSWSEATEYAARLAALLDAGLTGFFVHPSPAYMMPPYGAPKMISDIMQLTREMEEAALAASEDFVAWTHRLGVARSKWQVARGNLPDPLAQIANWHDLIVLERKEGVFWGSAHDVANLILHVNAPCIVVPPGIDRPGDFHCVVLAWNGAAESVRAIHASIPLLQRAQQVVLLSGKQRAPFDQVELKPPFDMIKHLLAHDIRAQRHSIESDDAVVGAELLELASGLRADLLVMGAYGRSRFSELVYGGATRHVLAHARLPVFMRH